MKKRFITVYTVCAALAIVGTLAQFTASLLSESKSGSLEADRSFGWISREAASAVASDGFMSDGFVRKLTEVCRKSRLLSAIVITNASGETVFAWPEKSASIRFDLNGKPEVVVGSAFMKSCSANLDAGAGTDPAVMTAVLSVLTPDAVFSASRFSFLLVLGILLVTLIVIVSVSPSRKDGNAGKARPVRTGAETAPAVPFGETETPVGKPEEFSFGEETEVIVPETEASEAEAAETEAAEAEAAEAADDRSAGEADRQETRNPEGLFSPVTGIGWEQYLVDRLEAELVRAASSEQDLALVILKVSGLAHTDLLSKRISQVLIDTFKFRDMVFEFGKDGFAGILQNVNLDQTMKIADSLYAGIDSILIELAHAGQISIGITTRTARLVPASRMIEEAESAERKAVEEPSLPIVAFRANPEKYRNFVADNT